MNYKKIYNDLIQKRSLNKLSKTGDGSIESHHIKPLCLNGVDNESNIINLTCREHLVAHLLLWKMYPDNDKLMLAVLKMNNMNSKLMRTRMTSHMFEYVRRRFTLWNIKHKSRYVEYNGEIHTIREWAEIKGIPYNLFRMFFYRGKTIDQIMNHTLVSKKTHEYNGKMYTVDELTKLLGISYYRLKYAFQHGISIEQVINNNVRFRYDKQLYGNVYKYNGEIGTIRFFANKYNITLSALRQRMKKYNHDIKKCIELKMNI